MNVFELWSNGIVSGFLFIFALIMQTKNLQSSLLFKVAPFAGGVALGFNVLNHFVG